ncbi:MAG TPA: SPOR domain-containing protein [Steroidobacteraceae bacterium]|nr:SPOR domain-containing protein [Steroidobacteraceae bacterium]
MENRLKERLTGAAILVALIVLVVPELFRGQRDAPPGGARGAADGPAVRSYVIDLKDSGVHDAAAAPAQPAMTAATAAAAVVAPPVAAPAPGAAPAVPPVNSAPASAPGWSVQLGLFAQRENAQRLLQAAQSKGFAVSISGADANGRYRVHLTGLADRAAAENLQARLRAQGFAAAIVGP